MTPIPIFRGFYYRRFCGKWWKNVLYQLTQGWVRDLQAVWHRGRYGWAPRDTWSLDSHISTVLAGSLRHLAKNGIGAPGGYPKKEFTGYDVVTDFEQWTKDLNRWADAFEAHATEDDLWKKKRTYPQIDADEKLISENLHKALQEMEPWYQSLWD